MLPWLGYVVAGTTDVPCAVTARPVPSEEEVAFILETARARARGRSGRCCSPRPSPL